MEFKIYTKTGDTGQTALFGGRRVAKSELRIDAYGTVDELNSQLGLLRDHLSDTTLRDTVQAIQNTLFSLGSHLASDPEKDLPVPPLEATHVTQLEQWIDGWEAELPALTNFILPGGHVAVSTCHVARCVCRRAERLTVALAAAEPVENIVLQYLNRLSDCLFVLARFIGHKNGAEEVVWKGNG